MNKSIMIDEIIAYHLFHNTIWSNFPVYILISKKQRSLSWWLFKNIYFIVDKLVAKSHQNSLFKWNSILSQPYRVHIPTYTLTYMSYNNLYLSYVLLLPIIITNILTKRINMMHTKSTIRRFKWLQPYSPCNQLPFIKYPRYITKVVNFKNKVLNNGVLTTMSNWEKV